MSPEAIIGEDLPQRSFHPLLTSQVLFPCRLLRRWTPQRRCSCAAAFWSLELLRDGLTASSIRGQHGHSIDNSSVQGSVSGIRLESWVILDT